MKIVDWELATRISWGGGSDIVMVGWGLLAYVKDMRRNRSRESLSRARFDFKNSALGGG